MVLFKLKLILIGFSSKTVPFVYQQLVNFLQIFFVCRSNNHGKRWHLKFNSKRVEINKCIYLKQLLLLKTTVLYNFNNGDDTAMCEDLNFLILNLHREWKVG